jgi:peptidoglycan/LPS O-acetylase OafA/YrhL
MRNKRLDVLRCIAVLLVLLGHGELPTRATSFGWVGVDLFFVLSGFLISGLLFTEYKKRGSIDFKRFFIRRGLKIYPAFDVLILATFVYQLLFHQLAPLSRYLCEIFFVQNYGSSIWGQTWSLGVEEHFYILLPLFLLLLIRYSPQRPDPFRVLPRAFLVVAIVCLVLRVITVLRTPLADLPQWNAYRWAYATTHCRMDSLFFGVLLGYLHHFRPGVLDGLLTPPKYRAALALLAAVLLSTCLFFTISSRIMLTIGLTCLYLGFGIVLMLSLRVRGVLPARLGKTLEPVGNALAYVGMYSYSIYLWHLPVQSWGFSFVRRFLHLEMGVLTSFVFYAVVSVAWGIFLSRLIEYPILRVRDRIFPPMPAAALETPASATV